jgi:hypothetical protein
MTARQWLTETIGATVSLLLVIVLFNMSIDIYGIFRDANGRHLPVYGDERVAKYLLSEKYVPRNFNAILIGSSVSANWNTHGIDGLRVYNESLDGGNIVEERTIADQALASSQIQVAVLIVHPYLTASHDFNTVRLTPRENLEALGSLNLLDAYKSEARIKLHLGRQEFDDFGTDDFGDIPNKMNLHLQQLMAPGDFYVDEIAMSNYKALIGELQAAKIPIVFVVPPLSQLIFASKADAFASYSHGILADKSDRDLIIDFTSDEFAGFRREPNNFKDGVHLTNQAAQQVIAEISARIDQWIRSGQPPNQALIGIAASRQRFIFTSR